MKLVQKILSHGLFIAFIVGAFLVYTKRAELFPQWFGASQPVAAKASSEKLADATPDAGAPATERKVSRPLPEKTLTKEPVAPSVPAPQEAAPSETAPEGGAPAPGQETSTPDTTSSSPQSAGQPAPEQAGEAGGTGVSEKKPVFRPLEEHEQQAAAGAAQSEPAPAPEAAPDQNAGGGAAAQPVFRPLDEGQPSTTTTATGEPEAAAVEAPAPEAGAPAETETTPAGQSEVTTASPQPAEEKVAVAAPAEVARAAAPKPAADDTAAAQMSAEAPAGGGDAQLQQMLEQARGLFWRRDLRGAAAAYTAASDAYPDNAEVWGEIGNFYFSLHQAEPAGEAYARAIELLARNDEPMRARRLLEVLFRLDPEKARELEARLRTQSGG